MTMETGESTQRIRVKIACEECRKNKRKCDGQRPTCFLCTKSGRECQYAAETSRKRRHYDGDLIRNLENQIRLLESALQSRSEGISEVQGGLHETISMSQCEQSGAEAQRIEERGSVDGPPALLLNTTSVDSRSTSAMEELASLMLEMGIEEKGEPSFTIAAGKRMPPETEHREPPLEDVVSNHPERPTEPPVPQVSQQLLEHLLDCFIGHFNGYHQFVDARDVERLKLQGVDAGAVDSRFRNAALLAVAARFSDRDDAKQIGATYSVLAQSLPFHSIKHRPSDLVVQGLALLAWQELVFGIPSMAYNYISMATGHVLYLGLHVTGLMKSTEAMHACNGLYARRIRSFWAYFSVDRLLTSRFGMNCTLHWQRVRLPPFRDVVDGKETLEEAAHESFCQLWHLWDSGMDQVYAFGWSQLTSGEREALVLRSHESLTEFHSKVDERLRLRKGNLPDSAVWFQMAYNTALLLIHRPLLNEPRGSSAATFALRSTTGAASTISRIIRSYRRSRKFGSLSPQVIDYILSAAVIHLLNATSGKTVLGRQAASGLRSCSDALTEIHERWPDIAAKAIQQIQDLAHRWKVVWALPVSLAHPLGLQRNTPEVGSPGGVNNRTPVPAQPSVMSPIEGHSHRPSALAAHIDKMWDPEQDQYLLHHFQGEADDQDFWGPGESYWETMVDEHERSTLLS
ncbi:uncharacterized protein A1O9_06885 [Exophiala aquamarina CBS 119918]|uniref:Zn(2)-C6 fungal-type domain-containing protein n=1 Tax=Exophiala aquamarina CBS 119918 TaxID=1182545 RepID=A0A072PA10_9EURO|nr:uncharacterized protein A1O9_06885 [Exophiala aquamarina CBS 119918]KEF56696.1 hypothetical protein A1O9_06885 [Exophiala aquamarina CBS 119918]